VLVNYTAYMCQITVPMLFFDNFVNLNSVSNLDIFSLLSENWPRDGISSVQCHVLGLEIGTDD